MARKVWLLALSGGEHVVELEHGWWSGRRRVRIDGDEVHHSEMFVDFGSEHRFVLAGHRVTVRIRPRVVTFEYALYVDGQWIDAAA